MKSRMLILLALLVSLVSVLPVSAQEETVCEDGYQLIVHVLGETCVPNNVERVVTIEHSMTEAVVTLGVQPVGVTEIELYNSVVNLPLPLSEDAVDIGSRREPNLEVITGLEPDLIIAASFRISGIYDELSAIAPTIALPGSEDVETMRQFFTTIAVALNREEEAEAILGEMDDYFAAVADYLVEFEINPRFVLSQTWYHEGIATFRLFTDNAISVEILNSLGFENAWDAEPNPDGFSLVDIEALGDITDTNFFYLTDPSSESFYAESELWNSLPFVVDETAYRLDDKLWLYGGPISAQRVVQSVLDSLGLDFVFEPVETEEVEETDVEAEETEEATEDQS
jgi:ABC-type Fe3+-hydroxamate transport system substrate-binding protein